MIHQAWTSFQVLGSPLLKRVAGVETNRGTGSVWEVGQGWLSSGREVGCSGQWLPEGDHLGLCIPSHVLAHLAKASPKDSHLPRCSGSAGSGPVGRVGWFPRNQPSSVCHHCSLNPEPQRPGPGSLKPMPGILWGTLLPTTSN